MIQIWICNPIYTQIDNRSILLVIFALSWQMMNTLVTLFSLQMPLYILYCLSICRSLMFRL